MCFLRHDPPVKEEHAPSDDFVLHAWVDESMQMPSQGREGLYLLAAAVETRTSSLNERDRRMFAALHARSAMPARLRIDFALPTDEPMLWVADAVAGAVGQARRGFALDVRDALGHGIDEIDISL